MTRILQYRVQASKIKDERDITQNEIIDTIKVKTSDRINWTRLRKMAPIPQWNEPHPKEPGFYLDVIHPNHVSRQVWELEAVYTLIKGGQVSPNPLEREASISGKSSLIEVPTYLDYKNDAITTTAREFIPGVMKRIPTVEYTIEKNLPADPAWLQTHLGSVNADGITIRGLAWPPKTLMLGAVSFGAYKVEERARYSEFQLTLMGNPQKWTQELFNVGTVELEQVEIRYKGKLRKIWRQKPILQGSPPVPVESPVPIDANGEAIVDLIDPETGATYKSGQLLVLKFDVQNILPFKGVLPLV